MNFIEYHEIITKVLPSLNLKTIYISGNANPDYNYDTTELNKLKRAINDIEDVPYIQSEISELKKTWLFETWSDSRKIKTGEKTQVDSIIKRISIKLQTFKEIAESSKLFNNDETLLIKIPEIQSFDNLAKYANDFKKAIESPILDHSIKGEVNILSADEGSIIFYISVGTIAAVKLIAGICWASAVIKKKNAEAKIFELHAKTLELKNDSLSNLIEAQKIQLKNILESEAVAIANKIYKHNEPETIERLKLSISTVADLIDRGVQILPLSKEEDIQKSFPDYKNMNLIESTIKQISSEN